MTHTAEHDARPQCFNGSDIEYVQPVKRCIIRSFKIMDIAVVGKSGERIVVMERKAA